MKTVSDDSDFEYHDVGDPIPEGLGTTLKAEMYRLFVMPVRPKKTTASGLLYIPDTSVDAEAYLNQLGRVAAIGEACFKGPHMVQLPITIGERLKVGDYIMFSARNPQRLRYRGTRILVIHDDWITGTIEPDAVHDVRFYL